MTHFRLSARGHTIQGEQFIFTLHVSQAVVIASDVLTPWVAALTAMWGTGTGTTAGLAQFYPTEYGIDQAVVDELDPVTGKNVRQAQSGLGLGDREMYLRDNFAPQRTRYEAYVAQMLALAGWDQPQAAAKAILAFETKVADAHWTRAHA